MTIGLMPEQLQLADAVAHAKQVGFVPAAASDSNPWRGT